MRERVRVRAPWVQIATAPQRLQNPHPRVTTLAKEAQESRRLPSPATKRARDLGNRSCEPMFTRRSSQARLKRASHALLGLSSPLMAPLQAVSATLGTLPASRSRD